MGQKVRRRERQQDKARERLMSVSTPKQIRREARAATRAQYQPLVREIKQERKASNLQQKRIRQYFPQYGAEVDKAAQTSSAATQQAIDQINSASTSASNYAEQLREKLAKEDQANAELRGATYDSSGSKTNVDAQLARINAANVLTGVTSSQGAVNRNYYADKKTIGKREQIEQQLREAARKRTYNKDLRAVAREKGAYKSAKLAELKDRERDFLLTQKAAKAERRSTRAAQRLQAKGQRIDARETRRSQAETRRHNLTTEQISAQNAQTSARNANTSRGNLRQRRKEARQDARQDRRDARQDRQGDPGEVTKALGLLNQADAKDIRTPQVAYEYLVAKGITPGAARAAIKRARRRAPGGEPGRDEAGPARP